MRSRRSRRTNTKRDSTSRGGYSRINDSNVVTRGGFLYNVIYYGLPAILMIVLTALLLSFLIIDFKNDDNDVIITPTLAPSIAPSVLNTGACCISSGLDSCEILTEDECLTNGIYFGDGSICTVFICEGACCNRGDSCKNEKLNQCGNEGGIMFLNETCSNVTCPSFPPTSSPTSSPTRTPTPQPTNSPTRSPTPLPTRFPTGSPTDAPTRVPTESPTNAPTNSPTNTPTNDPTSAPTDSPTSSPTNSPTNSPTDAPTNVPTDSPTDAPTETPTNSPTNVPTNVPVPPVSVPTPLPTNSPTNTPTNVPTNAPTNVPTNIPTNSPTSSPTNSPTNEPTNSPTSSPTNNPTSNPTDSPTNSPTDTPTDAPTNAPTDTPTNAPTVSPTPSPTQQPTRTPTMVPVVPTVSPTSSSVGACCLTSGQLDCDVSDESTCSSMGGVFAGTNVACTANTCLTACCLNQTFSCVFERILLCISQNGTEVRQLNVSCSSLPCEFFPPPVTEQPVPIPPITLIQQCNSPLNEIFPTDVYGNNVMYTSAGMLQSGIPLTNKSTFNPFVQPTSAWSDESVVKPKQTSVFWQNLVLAQYINETTVPRENTTIDTFTYPYISSTLSNDIQPVYAMPYAFYSRNQGMMVRYNANYQVARTATWTCNNYASGGFILFFNETPPTQQECIGLLGGDGSTTFASMGTPAYWRSTVNTVQNLDVFGFYDFFAWNLNATCDAKSLPREQCSIENTERKVGDPDKMSVSINWRYTNSVVGNMKMYLVRGVPIVTMYYEDLVPLICFSRDRVVFGLPYGGLFEMISNSKWRIYSQMEFTGVPEVLRELLPNYETTVLLNQTWTFWSETPINDLAWSESENCISLTNTYTGWIKGAAVYDLTYDSDNPLGYEALISQREVVIEEHLNVTVVGAQLFIGDELSSTGSNILGYSWRVNENDTVGEPLVCALPHHLNNAFEMSRVTDVQLDYFTYRGTMKCFSGCSWVMYLESQNYDFYGPCAIYQQNVTDKIREHANYTSNTLPTGSPNIFSTVNGQPELYNWGKAIVRIARFLLSNDMAPNSPYFFTPFNERLALNYSDNGNVGMSLFDLPLDTFRTLITNLLDGIPGPSGYIETTSANGFNPVIENLCVELSNGTILCKNTGNLVPLSPLPVYDSTWGAMTYEYTISDYTILIRNSQPPHFGTAFHNDQHFTNGTWRKKKMNFSLFFFYSIPYFI